VLHFIALRAANQVSRVFLHLIWDEKLPGHQLAKLLASPTVSPIWIFSKSQGDDLYG
jgi:hypothetical protein